MSDQAKRAATPQCQENNEKKFPMEKRRDRNFKSQIVEKVPDISRDDGIVRLRILQGMFFLIIKRTNAGTMHGVIFLLGR